MHLAWEYGGVSVYARACACARAMPSHGLMRRCAHTFYPLHWSTGSLPTQLISQPAMQPWGYKHRRVPT